MPAFFNSTIHFREAAGIAHLPAAIAALQPGRLKDIEKLVLRLHPKDLEAMAVEDRYDLIRKLGPKPEGAGQDILDRRSIIATLLLMSQPYPRSYEKFETAWIAALLKTDAHLYLRKRQQMVYLKNPDLPDFAARMIDAQTYTFRRLVKSRWAQRPAHIGSFSLGKEDFKRLWQQEAAIYPAAVSCYEHPGSGKNAHRFPGIPTAVSRMIAFNMHDDTGWMSPITAARLSFHEQVHLLCHHALDLEEKNMIEPHENPFHEMMPAIRQELGMYDFIMDNFADTAYMSMMTERPAYSFMKKFYEQYMAGKNVSELEYLMGAVEKSKPDWSDILYSRIDELGHYALVKDIMKNLMPVLKDTLKTPEPAVA